MPLLFPIDRIVTAISAAALLASCASIGPNSISRDQFNYNAAIGSSWQTQMLLNIIKLRYGDTPVFLEVSSVVNQYQLESEVGLSLLDASPNEQELGATGSYTDKPTISYSPIKGEKFTRGLLTPIPPETVFSLIQAGWPADLVLRVSVRTVNGIRNRVGGLLGGRRADPEFQELVDSIRRIQAADGVGLRVEARSDHKVSLITFPATQTREVEDDIRRVRTLLGVDHGISEFPLVFGAVRQSGNELALLTRSMLELMAALASYIDVPQVHVEDNRVTPNLPRDAGAPLIRVHSAAARPDDEFVAVPYRGHWFWVADTDLRSKRMFTVLVLLFSLIETGDISPVAPVLTIPAG